MTTAGPAAEDTGPDTAAAAGPPAPVRAAAGLVGAQGVGVIVLAVAIVASGLRNRAATGQLFAQGAYYLVLAAVLIGCGIALFRGARWARTPVLVLQMILLAVAYWMAVPSARPGIGALLALFALLTGGLLLSKPATVWARQWGLATRTIAAPAAARPAQLSPPAPAARPAARSEPARKRAAGRSPRAAKRRR